jgi:hypothetical protein
MELNNMKQIAMINFSDRDSKDEGFLLVKVAANTIGLTLSLKQNGDIEVFFGTEECERLLDALQIAVADAMKPQS